MVRNELSHAKIVLKKNTCGKNSEICRFLITLLILKGSILGSQTESGEGLIKKEYYEETLQMFKLQNLAKFIVIISSQKILLSNCNKIKRK